MAILSQRYCVEDNRGRVECFGNSFWYTKTGIIVKWAILLGFLAFFMAWVVGGYYHARRRLRKGKPLLAYHRWLIPYRERQRWGQVPQHNYTYSAYYAQQQQQQQPGPYTLRPDGTYAEPPPLYNPAYTPPPGASKTAPAQGAGGADVEMNAYAPPAYPPPAHQTPTEPQELPPRPNRGVAGFMSRFRK